MIKLNRFSGGHRKALALSYDDGREEDRRLVEIFNKYKVKGTFHLNSEYLHLKDRIKENEIKDLYKGHEVSTHSYSHPYLTNLPQEELIFQITEDRKRLEAATTTIIKGHSYPFGKTNDKVKNALKSSGIVYARTNVCTGNYDMPEDFLAWNPTCHHNQQLMKKAEDFANGKFSDSALQLFSIYGHSFEFTRDNNWNLIEEFCEYISGYNDIWVTTYIEIYNYVNALRMLDFSSDRTMIYNPTVYTLWFTLNNETLKIQGGQSLKVHGA